MSKDARSTFVANEVYRYLEQMCQMNGTVMAELISELNAKQQLADIRAVLVEDRSAAERGRSNGRT